LKGTTLFKLFAPGAALMLGASAVHAQSFDRPQRVDTTLSLERNGTVRVSIYSGHVNVVGTSGSSVRIRGTSERDELDIRDRSGSITVSLEPERGHGGRAELEISVPIGTNVVLEAFSAPLSVRGVKGEVKLETLSGSLVIDDAVGDVSAESVSGGIDVSKIDGDLRAESVSGSIGMTDVNGSVATETVSGRINMLGIKSKSVRAESVSGSIGYSGTIEPTGNYVLKTHSGRLTLGIPANAGATVGLQTFSGTVDSEFPVTMETGKQRLGYESKFEFRIGDGRARIILETFSGNIIIQRSTNRDNEE
jgi:DUF4097 and DUF4098 domain-containing protein YvlB